MELSAAVQCKEEKEAAHVTELEKQLFQQQHRVKELDLQHSESQRQLERCQARVAALESQSDRSKEESKSVRAETELMDGKKAAAQEERLGELEKKLVEEQQHVKELEAELVERKSLKSPSGRRSSIGDSEQAGSKYKQRRRKCGDGAGGNVSDQEESEVGTTEPEGSDSTDSSNQASAERPDRRPSDTAETDEIVAAGLRAKDATIAQMTERVSSLEALVQSAKVKP